MIEKEKLARAVFTVKDCPLGVWRGISEPAKMYCNDIYWVRLKELLDKERELETIRMAIQNGLIMHDNHKQDIVEETPVIEVKKKEYVGSARRTKENDEE